MPPSIVARTPSGLTASPQSTAATTRSTLTVPPRAHALRRPVHAPCFPTYRRYHDRAARATAYPTPPHRPQAAARPGVVLPPAHARAAGPAETVADHDPRGAPTH